MKEKLLVEEAQYEIRMFTDIRLQQDYLDMWGVLDNGNLFLFRTPLESIRESVELANRFLAYVGLGAAFFSALVILLVSGKVTEPIMELVRISGKMIQLDFDAKYTGNSKTEIALLGKNINELSETLENTISELKSANNELKRDIERKNKIDEMRIEFLSNVSHELKTPLAAISGYSELIENGMASGEDAVRFAAGIRQSADRLLTLINDTIRLSELDTVSKETAFEQVDLYEIARDSVEMLQIRAEERDVRLSLEGGCCKILGDRQMMEELLYNLCDNGMSYNVPGGSVLVSVKRDENAAVLRVKDTGIGIPKACQDRIFERFYRVDKSRSKSTGGTGLGLAIVKHIVAVHQAEISLTSEENQGTEVTVIFRQSALS